MVRAVVEPHLDVDDRVAGEEALGQQLADALLDRRDEVPRDDAADDRRPRTRSRCRAAAARARARQSPYWPWPPVCFLCLPCALAVPLIVSLYGTFGAFSSTSTPNLRFRRSTATSTWSWPDARDDELLRLLVAVDAERGVLLHQAVEALHDLVVVGLVLRLEGEGDRGRRVGERRVDDRAASRRRACRRRRCP